MASVSERIAQLRAQATPEAQKLLEEYADTLHAPKLLSRLENAPKPLTHVLVLNAIVDAVLGDRTRRKPADSGEAR